MSSGHFRNPVNRREFLSVGTAGLGLTLPGFLRVRRPEPSKRTTSTWRPRPSVIHIFLPGGMAHQESFDPKPFAPIEYRGELGIDRDQDPRATNSPSRCRRPPRSPTRSR